MSGALREAAVAAVLLYWFHRACHAWEPLWRVHRVHHSAEHLDWVAAHREHPRDGLLSQLLLNLLPLALGFSVEVVGTFFVFRGLWSIFIHCNCRLPLGPLRYLLGAPEVHAWHHARSDALRPARTCGPLWADADRLQARPRRKTPPVEQAPGLNLSAFAHSGAQGRARRAGVRRAIASGLLPLALLSTSTDVATRTSFGSTLRTGALVDGASQAPTSRCPRQIWKGTAQGFGESSGKSVHRSSRFGLIPRSSSSG